MKRKLTILTLALAALMLSTAAAYAHQGVEHTILGTVKEIAERQLVVAKQDGKMMTIVLTEQTKYTKAKSEAKHSDLAVGSRVSIEVEEDGKTAVSVKIGTAKTSG